MRLHRLVKKARREVLSEEADICGFLFSDAKAQHACRLFLDFLKMSSQSCTRKELSQFATDLQAGVIEKGFTYHRSSFYRNIHGGLLRLGFLALEPRFNAEKDDVCYCYVPVAQPIPKRGPDGWSFAKLSWILCKRWNEEFKLRSEIPFEE